MLNLCITLLVVQLKQGCNTKFKSGEDSVLFCYANNKKSSAAKTEVVITQIRLDTIFAIFLVLMFLYLKGKVNAIYLSAAGKTKVLIDTKTVIGKKRKVKNAMTTKSTCSKTPALKGWFRNNSFIL